MAKSSTQKRPYSLYLVRHGIASQRGNQWPDDAKRPLTSKGIARMRKVVQGLNEVGVRVDLVLTSPLARAKQTAELLVQGLKPTPALASFAALAPGASPIEAAQALGAFRKHRRIALVGHEPGLGVLAGWLVGSRSPIRLKKGAVCRVDVTALPPSGNGQLIWLAPPRILKRLA